MGKLIILVVMVVALGGGIGAGMYLRPAVPEAALQPDPLAGELAPAMEPENTSASEYYEFDAQFVVPIVTQSDGHSIMVINIALEIAPGARGQVTQTLPRLRDGFLRVMFDHANSGGFEGVYTTNGKLDQLRRALRETGVGIMGPGSLREVMITGIVRARG